MTTALQRGIRAAQVGLAVNAALALAKLFAGIVGNTYALIADAVESVVDIFSSVVVWGGLRVASRDPDEAYPFGYGRAESLAASIVSLMLVGAAVFIGVEAVREIRRPHLTPAPWTLIVLVAVMAIKWLWSRKVHAVGTDIHSTAVKADAWHHLSDAITSGAAFVGIAIALLGARYAGGSGWESADDWAALFAAIVIFWNGGRMLQPALHDLMDRAPGSEFLGQVRRAAESVPGVLATEKLFIRKTGTTYRVTIHVHAAPTLSLRDAHTLGGMVKGAIKTAVPQVESVLVHMEPFEP